MNDIGAYSGLLEEESESCRQDNLFSELQGHNEITYEMPPYDDLPENINQEITMKYLYINYPFGNDIIQKYNILFHNAYGVKIFNQEVKDLIRKRITFTNKNGNEIYIDIFVTKDLEVSSFIQSNSCEK